MIAFAAEEASAMTIRDAINRQKRRAALVTYGGFALFAAPLLLSTVFRGIPEIIAAPGFVLVMAGVITMLFVIRCPKCRGSIGYAVSYPGTPWSVSKKIRFCPFCGVPFDSEIEVFAEPSG